MKQMSKIIITDASVDDASELLAIYAPYVQHTAVLYGGPMPVRHSRVANIDEN